MLDLSQDSRVRFLGYNTKYGHKMYGTLKGCESACIEMPVAENLISSVAMGMSLEGFIPIICIERSNFLLPMLDSIINHIYLMPKMSGYQFNCPLVIRVVIPSDAPLNPGLQHLGDYTGIISAFTDIPLIEELKAYKCVPNIKSPICIVEYKELYETSYSS